jgi:glutamate N-acetyltransferase / amino-acid N-acetyltransferase
VVGVAKGSGMIHPNMATMFAFLLTDARVDQAELRAVWARVVRRTFNQITVDGDTSTNDMAIVLASGRLAADAAELAEALERVAGELARAIARDGEGATTLITVLVRRGRNEAEAMAAARGVAGLEPGEVGGPRSRPQLGPRALGRRPVGRGRRPQRRRVRLQGTTVYQGRPCRSTRPPCRRRCAPTTCDRGRPGRRRGRGHAWGCDLSADYVKINALYTT